MVRFLIGLLMTLIMLVPLIASLTLEMLAVRVHPIFCLVYPLVVFLYYGCAKLCYWLWWRAR